MPMLPYGKQSIGDEDINAVVEVLKSDFLTKGPVVEAFEAELCKVTGARHAIACCNGTAALHLASLAVGIKEGQGVIVPTLTFLATANAPHYNGAEIIFCDVDPRTGLMTAENFQQALHQAQKRGVKVSAVFPVHLNGQCADLSEIRKIANSQKIKVIADSCHAIGGIYKGKSVGSCEFEDISAFSFHPVKTIAMGEGGALTTNDDSLAEKMRNLRTHNMTPAPDKGPWYYEMHEPGYNYRASDINCALGLSQLKKLSRFVEKRCALFQIYSEALKDLSPKVLPPHLHDYNTPAWHLYAVRFDFDAIGMSRGDFMLKLRERDVGTQVHYVPVHQQPYYKKLYGEQDLPGAQEYYDKALSLPLYVDMSEGDVFKVVETIKSII